MDTVDNAAERVRAALMQLFAERANGFLAAQGHDPLAASAFVPLVQGEPARDTVCAAWSGTIRTGDGETWDLRDEAVIMTVNVWAKGRNDVAAQQRASAIEAALVACLDQDALDCTTGNTASYLLGACSGPVDVGSTRSVTAEDKGSNNLIWHLLLPLSCPVQVGRPQFPYATEEE